MANGEYKAIVIRRAEESDAETILAITKEAFEKYAFDLGRPDLVYALSDDEEKIVRDIRTKNVFVATLEGVPVGTIRYHNEAGVALITRFGVTLKAQSCGVGGALVRTVVEDAAKNGFEAVALHTSAKMASLIRFYYGQGFYIRTTSTDRGYVRALLVRELKPGVDVDIVALKP
ncbi:MAG: GNAT family N-acetyltransferase [Bacillota bacterium]